MILKSKTNIFKDYNIINLLRKENRSNEYFEIMVNNLSLEELIALKLQLAFKAIGFIPESFPLWRSIEYITKDAVLRHVVSSYKSYTQASKILGINKKQLRVLLKKYNTFNYCIKGNEDNE